ncbi:transposase [Micromonospora sp. NPDC007220]|uniref:transposase n=1 Tax=Micromonospora sp. NPDC007220 TaxID=3154318 RepID=UPI0033E3954C
MIHATDGREDLSIPVPAMSLPLGGAKEGLLDLLATTTIETGWPQILAFLITRITNAGSEGTNRLIKAVARDAYCSETPESTATRRTATARRHRGHLNPA